MKIERSAHSTVTPGFALHSEVNDEPSYGERDADGVAVINLNTGRDHREPADRDGFATFLQKVQSEVWYPAFYGSLLVAGNSAGWSAARSGTA